VVVDSLSPFMADTSMVRLTAAERSPQTISIHIHLSLLAFYMAIRGLLVRSGAVLAVPEMAADFSDGGHGINSSPGSTY
jgi:hypothetical protein